MSNRLRKEALELACSTKVSVLATVDKNTPGVRFMEHIKVDEGLSLWYATASSSNKVRQIKSNPKVGVLIFNDGCDLRITGKAEIITDKKIKDRLWQDKWQIYFPQGRSDPEYTIIKVIPAKIEYRNRQKFGHLPRII